VRPAPTSLEQQVEIETPEHVAFAYTVAGVGSRAAAAVLDAVVCIGGYLALLLVVSLVVRRAGLEMFGGAAGRWAVAFLLVGQFLIFWGYYVLFEGLRDGQTPGKRRFGLRVVQDGGYSVSFAASAARNLLRVIDMQPGIAYGVGLFSVALSRSGKRLGDWVAGTIVVQERRVALGAARPQAIPPSDAPRPVSTLLDEAEYALLDRFVARRDGLEATRRRQLAAQLAARLRPRTLGGAADDETFLVALATAERDARRHGAAARSDTGARREQHAIVARGLPEWEEFEARLTLAQRRGLAALGEEGVSDFVARYRAATTDLARLRTAARGRDEDAVYYLSRLVAAGHNLLYRQERVRPAAVGRYVLRTIPREMRRSWRLVLLAALLLVGPAVGGFIATRTSESAVAQLVPRGLVDRAESGMERAERGGGYLPEADAGLRGALLSSIITTNNLQVTFVAFAGGVLLGLGTVFALVFNGVAAVGAPLGLYARMGLLDQILGFVLPHGVLELTAICLAGAAGLHLGAALWLPGALTRRDALVVRGRRALDLVAGAAVLLLVAGLIEGNVSPLVWPLWAKGLCSAGTAVGLAWYWNHGRRGAVRAGE
jgi:uncharacterized membrane protein SpoIIM required for sporulation/uncharacterized RDD family membrane protein YckC